MIKTTLIVFPAVVLLVLTAGCASYEIIGYDAKTNFVTFNHPFTDSSFSEIQAKAESICKARGQAAIQTGKVCSLSKCTTTYQCETSANINKYGL